MGKRRVGRYPRAFRQMAVDRLRKCDNVVALSEELGVHRRLPTSGDSKWSRWSLTVFLLQILVSSPLQGKSVS
jgi:transposase-like protein